MPEEVTIEVPFIKAEREFFCSENVTSMYLARFDINISPEELHERGCYSIDTIAECLTEEMEAEHVKVSMGGKERVGDLRRIIKAEIDKGYPLIASIVPDSNWIEYKRQDELALSHYVHSVLIVGYKKGTKILFMHDQKPNQAVLLDEFFKLSKRTNHTFIVVKMRGGAFERIHLKKELIKMKPDFSMIYKESLKRGVEMGFPICEEEETHGLSVGTVCSGDECSVEVGECEKYKRKMGTFHTHIGEGATEQPNIKDITLGIVNDHTIACIAGNEKILCVYYNKNHIYKQVQTMINLEPRYLVVLSRLEEMTITEEIDTFVEHLMALAYEVTEFLWTSKIDK
jgi:hypothetical protein